jgi:hypothetical protein
VDPSRKRKRRSRDRHWFPWLGTIPFGDAKDSSEHVPAYISRMKGKLRPFARPQADIGRGEQRIRRRCFCILRIKRNLSEEPEEDSREVAGAEQEGDADLDIFEGGSLAGIARKAMTKFI